MSFCLSLSNSSLPWDYAPVARSYQTSACILFPNAFFDKVRHMIKPRVRVGGDGDYTQMNQNQPYVSFFFKVHLFIYLWLLWVFIAMCRLFLVVTRKGYTVVVMCGLLIAKASLVAEDRLSNLASVVMVHWLCCPRACGIFLYQGSKCVSCIGRQILKLWTTRKVQLYVSYKEI